jgi:hypothetical protein
MMISGLSRCQKAQYFQWVIGGLDSIEMMIKMIMVIGGQKMVEKVTEILVSLVKAIFKGFAILGMAEIGFNAEEGGYLLEGK